MVKQILFSALISIPVLSSCGSTKKVYDMSGISDNDTIHIKVGETYNMKVKENVTTGYTWSYNRTQKCAVDIQDEYVTDKHAPGMVGVGGQRNYSIKGTQEGFCSIVFFHSRGNKLDEQAIETKKITFIVK